MSHLNVFALGALMLAHAYVYIQMDGWMQKRSDAIDTGFIGAAPLSLQSRWMILHVRWVPLVSAIVAWQSIMGIVWMAIGNDVGLGEVRLAAQVFAFIVFVSALGWLVLAPFWYLQLRSVLRAAEQV